MRDLLLGILGDPRSIPEQLKERNGSRQRSLAELVAMLSATSYRRGSDRVTAASGNHVDRMIIRAEVKRQVVSDDGTESSGPLEKLSPPFLNPEIPG